MLSTSTPVLRRSLLVRRDCVNDMAVLSLGMSRLDLVRFEVDVDANRGLAIARHELPALHGVFRGGAEHLVAVRGFGRGYAAIRRHGRFYMHNAGDAHALGNFRVDWRNPLF